MTDPVASSPPGASLPPVAFGAAYYFEYQLSDRLDTDLDLMAAAGFTVIRVGESVWSTWEPRDGEFDLEWLAPVLDGAHARGIRVILGTPTYAIPPWLQVKHPELAVQRADGSSMPWGSRQEVDYSQPLFREYAERVIRVILDRYATHPAVVGFQVDNEPGLHAFHNPGAIAGFRDELTARYGDVETLNREWGLTYWSHRISSWTELWAPEGNAQPQYDLAWRRYQARLTTDFIAWQAALVGEYRGAHHFITTCIAYPRPSIDDERISSAIDITAANPYYGVQDHLELGTHLPPASSWTTSGVPGLLRQAERAYSSRQSNFLVTETNASSIGLSDLNQPGYPGQLKLAALTLISRGASMIEYWHWHSLHFGTETYWGGILPHSQRPGRFYAEAADIGAFLGRAGDALAHLEPDADIAMLYSNDSKWALEFTPALRTSDGRGDRHTYETIFDAFHVGAVEAGRQVRIVHSDQLDQDPAALAARFPVLFAPAFYIATDAELALLNEYAQAGGHLVVGPRTGYADEEARARLAVAPPHLSAPAGVWYEEFSNLDAPLGLHGSEGFDLPDAARAELWIEGLVTEGADVLATYDHREFGRFPAATTRSVGAGRITYVGTVPNSEFASTLARWAAPERVTGDWQHADQVLLTSGVGRDGRRVWFVGNFSGEDAWATTPHPVRDLDTGDLLPAGHRISLTPWAAVALGD